MGQLIGREELQTAAATRLSALAAKHRAELLRLITEDPAALAVKPGDAWAPRWTEFWRGVESDIASELGTLLVLGWMSNADQHGIGASVDDPRAAVFASGRASDVAQRYVAHSKKRLADAMDRWRQTGASTAEIQSDLESIFGDARIDGLVITETTVAASAAIVAAMADPDAGMGTKLVWRLGDAEHCSLCELLDGTGEEVFRVFAIGGPPVHVRCACYLDIVPGDTPTVEPDWNALHAAATSIGI